MLLRITIFYRCCSEYIYFLHQLRLVQLAKEILCFVREGDEQEGKIATSCPLSDIPIKNKIAYKPKQWKLYTTAFKQHFCSGVNPNCMDFINSVTRMCIQIIIFLTVYTVKTKCRWIDGQVR